MVNTKRSPAFRGVSDRVEYLSARAHVEMVSPAYNRKTQIIKRSKQ